MARFLKVDFDYDANKEYIDVNFGTHLELSPDIHRDHFIGFRVKNGLLNGIHLYLSVQLSLTHVIEVLAATYYFGCKTNAQSMQQIEINCVFDGFELFRRRNTKYEEKQAFWFSTAENNTSGKIALYKPKQKAKKKIIKAIKQKLTPPKKRAKFEVEEEEEEEEDEDTEEEPKGQLISDGSSNSSLQIVGAFKNLRTSTLDSF